MNADLHQLLKTVVVGRERSRTQDPGKNFSEIRKYAVTVNPCGKRLGVWFSFDVSELCLMHAITFIIEHDQCY